MESFHGNYEHLHDLLNSIMHPLFYTGANQGFYLITVEIIGYKKKAIYPAISNISYRSVLVQKLFDVCILCAYLCYCINIDILFMEF